MVKVYVERDDKTVSVKAKTVREVFKKLKINPVTVIVVKNNELVAEDSKLREKDELKLLSVISGG